MRSVYRHTWWGFALCSVLLTIIFGVFILLWPQMGVGLSITYLPIMAIVFIMFFIIMTLFGFLFWMNQEGRRRTIEVTDDEEGGKDKKEVENLPPTSMISDDKQLQMLRTTRFIAYVALLLSIIAIFKKWER